MLSINDLRRIAKQDDESNFFVDENDNIISKETNECVTTLKELLPTMRRKLHCDFSIVYDLHAILFVILRCNECGTVIFTYEDEDYDPNLCCPVCGEYHTHFKYWTKEEIEADESKRNEIQFYEKMAKEQEEEYQRYLKRGHKWDYQIGKCKIKISKKKILYLHLECNNLHRTKLQGLRLDVRIGEKDGVAYVIKKHCTIPLSLSHLKTHLRVKKMLKKEANE